MSWQYTNTNYIYWQIMEGTWMTRPSVTSIDQDAINRQEPTTCDEINIFPGCSHRIWSKAEIQLIPNRWQRTWLFCPWPRVLNRNPRLSLADQRDRTATGWSLDPTLCSSRLWSAALMNSPHTFGACWPAFRAAICNQIIQGTFLSHVWPRPNWNARRRKVEGIRMWWRNGASLE